jgi:predicted Zn-dependent protease with MMP-like domain
MLDLDDETFRELVIEALAGIPADLTDQISNVAIVITDQHPQEPDLLGLYEGIPLTERGDHYSGVMPDRITLFRVPILQSCATVMEVVDEVRVTVLHEVAHHFGIDDDHLTEWGWG